MKLIQVLLIIATVILLGLIFSSCAVSKNVDHQEQASLICYIKEASNKAILKLQTTSGKEVIYYQKVRGVGFYKWEEGAKYTVHFSGNVVTKISRNQ